MSRESGRRIPASLHMPCAWKVCIFHAYGKVATYNHHRGTQVCIMQSTVLTLVNRIWNALRREEGQDLIEYALIVALIAFAAVAGMTTVAGDINTAFQNIGTTLTTYTA